MSARLKAASVDHHDSSKPDCVTGHASPWWTAKGQVSHSGAIVDRYGANVTGCSVCVCVRVRERMGTRGGPLPLQPGDSGDAGQVWSARDTSAELTRAEAGTHFPFIACVPVQYWCLLSLSLWPLGAPLTCWPTSSDVTPHPTRHLPYMEDAVPLYLISAAAFYLNISREQLVRLARRADFRLRYTGPCGAAFLMFLKLAVLTSR